MFSLTEPSQEAWFWDATSHSGAWVFVLPVAACGLHLDNDAE